MAGPEIERMVQLLARLPGLGPRSARRAALFLIKRRDSLLEPLGRAIAETLDRVRACSVCGNLDSADPCAICADSRRDETMLCVVEDVASLWALERSGAFRGRYHVLGGVLSALEGVGPEDLGIPGLVQRVAAGPVREVILALSATVDGQTTAHYIVDRLAGASLRLTGLAHGVPVGGELDYLDEGTISAALAARRPM
ncbi:MAG: recombination protein RecR [Alphaproteobacteria bacterium]|nr:recombination protein RecR [Alphaproteobacteria bacterium]